MAFEFKAVAPADFPFEQKLRFLLRRESYPENPLRVESIETHMSWVFLTETHAYKLKKPVRYDFLDFSTLEARKFDSEEEVRLNQRLAPSVYLGVLPLTLDSTGALEMGGDGTIVDWLVKMRRLPTDQMLAYGIRQGVITQEDLKRAAMLLSKFYLSSTPVSMTETEYLDRFNRYVNANLRELLDSRYQLPQDIVADITTAQLVFLKEDSELLKERVQGGKIIEAHGDLRPEHICLGPEPVVIDCLEFNREYRILDIVDELAFLAMECDRLDALSVGRLFIDTYSEVSGDKPPQRLLDFYKSYRAMLRAKIALWHLNDSGAGDPKRWTNLAREYLFLAAVYTQGL